MVAPDWNLNEPGQLGIEHRDVGFGHAVIDSANDVGELQLTARATADWDTIELYAGNGAQAGLLPSIYNNLPRPVLLELMEQGDEAWGALSYNDFQVTAVTGVSGMWNENLSLPITASRLNTFSDGLYIVSNKIGSYFDAQFSCGSFGLDRHVLAVEPFVRINVTTRITRFDTPTTSVWEKDIVAYTGGWAILSARWGEAIVEPGASAWKAWTPQMVRDFGTGGSRKVRISCRAGPGSWRIDRLYLRVYSIPERRRGVGVGSPTSSLFWVPFEMNTPAGTGSPVVTVGEEMTLQCRRITDYNFDTVASAVMPWRYLRGEAGDDTWRRHSQAFTPTIATTSNGQSLMPAAGPQIDGIPAVRILDSGVVIADSMPYSLSRGAACFGANTVSQFLTIPAGSTVYGQAYVVAGWKPTTGRPAAPLRAEVYRVSDGVKVLDAVEISAADVERLPVTAPVSNSDDAGAVYKTVRLRFPAGADLTTAQHELRFSSPDSTEEQPWFVAALIGEVHTTNQTFGGSTDTAAGWYYSGSPPALLQLTNPSRSSDIQAQLVEVPAAVTGVGASNGSLTAHHVEVCSGESSCQGCTEDTMPYVQLTWSPAPSGNPDVEAYQIDRRDDLAPDWERVALVHGRFNDTWNDHEVRIGVRSEYRVRTLRTDDVTGDWSDPVEITVPGGQVALAFSSNAATGMGCVYPEVWTGEVNRTWSFREFDDVELRRMYGRDREVAFRPLERRGDGFTRTVLLSFGCTVALPSMDLFAPLRNLAWAAVPYVCIRDGEGNRWLASLRVPDGRNRRADAKGTEMWLAEIGIVEVAASPSVHDTAVEQVESAAS